MYTNSRPTLTTFDYTLDIPNNKIQNGNGIPADGYVERQPRLPRFYDWHHYLLATHSLGFHEPF